jgi:hypothetical protein
MKRLLALVLASYLLILAPGAFAGMENGGLPECTDVQGDPIQENNEQVLGWKKTTPNQFHGRGFITGMLVEVLADRADHLHLDVYIGQNGLGAGWDNDIEIVYNQAFGKVTGPLKPGMEITACGDYITSTRQSGRYPPSPVGVIIHWIHKSPRPAKHVSGFLVIDGRLYGQEDAHSLGAVSGGPFRASRRESGDGGNGATMIYW